MIRQISILTLIMSSAGYAHVKAITPQPDQLLQIKTAIGIATIVQVPDAIQSAIIGDQSGFKVEYLDRAVTIKPLRSGARTNLYLITAKQRFNLTLTPSHQDQADYVVYIKDNVRKVPVRWVSFLHSAKNDELDVKVMRVGVAGDGSILINGQISSSSYQSIRPQDFWLYQGKDSRVLASLFLSDRHVSKKTPVSFGISIAKTDFSLKEPLTLTLKLDEPLSIRLPESLWK